MQGFFNSRSSQARSLQCKELSSKESFVQGALKQRIFGVLKGLSSKRSSVQGPLKEKVFSARSSQARSLQCT